MRNSDFSERVEVWERWQTIDGVVYFEWKLPHEKKWHRKPTAHKSEPVVLRKFFTTKEWNIKELELLDNQRDKRG